MMNANSQTAMSAVPHLPEWEICRTTQADRRNANQHLKHILEFDEADQIAIRKEVRYLIGFSVPDEVLFTIKSYLLLPRETYEAMMGFVNMSLTIPEHPRWLLNTYRDSFGGKVVDDLTPYEKNRVTLTKSEILHKQVYTRDCVKTHTPLTTLVGYTIPQLIKMCVKEVLQVEASVATEWFVSLTPKPTQPQLAYMKVMNTQHCKDRFPERIARHWEGNMEYLIDNALYRFYTTSDSIFRFQGTYEEMDKTFTMKDAELIARLPNDKRTKVREMNKMKTKLRKQKGWHNRDNGYAKLADAIASQFFKIDFPKVLLKTFNEIMEQNDINGVENAMSESDRIRCLDELRVFQNTEEHILNSVCDFDKLMNWVIYTHEFTITKEMIEDACA